MTNWARSERNALCDLFVEVGADAPTLSGEWTTRDLAAHLVVRETRPDAAAGILLSALAEHGEKVRLAVAERQWPELIDDVRGGPPIWSPMRIEVLDRVTNTIEFFVHHEDVRRAGTDWEPRSLDAELETELWAHFHRAVKLILRKAPCGVTLTLPDGTSVVANKQHPSVTLTAPASELVLFCYGRQAHSRVDITGPDDLVDALRVASLGL